VLEDQVEVVGFITISQFLDQGYGPIDNNGADPDRAGQGWVKFMYQHTLDYFRRQGLRYAHLDTRSDTVHILVRKAYESAGFDHQVPNVE
jgi:ribosomal protein S18 acetylase RimI-like enzyme